MAERSLSKDKESTHSSDDTGSENNASGTGALAPAPVRNASSRSRRRTKVILAAVLVCLALLALALGLGLGLGLRSSQKQNHHGPNVLVVMTDDQDALLDSMSVMPQVKSLIGDQGVTYDKHYCTVAWCCPSRVNFLTGKAAHNTNVTSVVPPYGGWPKFTKQGLNDDYLGPWISNAGINTYYIGKFMNGYARKNMASPAPPKGWTDNSFLMDPWTYNYYNSHWTNKECTEAIPHKGIHTTDVTQSKALAMLDEAAGAGKQFFMMVAPVAPHQELGGGAKAPPVPERYRGVFSNRTAPRTTNFNPDRQSGASWVKQLPLLSEKQIKDADKVFNHRLGNLAAIDDMVAELIKKLESHGILDNTYVIYTTDNGFHIGNHRLKPGKRCPYEEDINIPLLMRGPGIPKGVTSSATHTHTDMAPTILQMLGVPLRDDFDGQPIGYDQLALDAPASNELVNVEFWNGGNTPVGVAKHEYYNNTYKALRYMDGDNSFYYSTWCTGEHEFYDMNIDAQQMNNRMTNRTGTPGVYYGRPETELWNRLDTLLMVMKSCKQDSCREPFKQIFPSGQVNTLQEAMDSKYDTFFLRQPQVTFAACKAGYIPSEEGPMTVNAYPQGS